MSTTYDLIALEHLEPGAGSGSGALPTFNYTGGNLVMTHSAEVSTGFGGGMPFYFALIAGQYVGEAPVQIDWNVSSISFGTGNTPSTGVFRSTTFDGTSAGAAATQFANSSGTISPSGPYTASGSGTLVSGAVLLEINFDYVGVPFTDITVTFTQFDLVVEGSSVDRFWTQRNILNERDL